jgi:hypothetical protein
MEIKTTTGQIDEQFLQGMSNRMDVSFYKYGDFSTNYVGKYSKSFLKDLKETIESFLARWEDRVSESTTARGNAILFVLRRMLLYTSGGVVKVGTVTPGNTEYLMDAANGLMIEFHSPQVSKAKFKATDSNKSPGFTGNAENEVNQAAAETYKREGD